MLVDVIQEIQFYLNLKEGDRERTTISRKSFVKSFENINDVFSYYSVFIRIL